MLEVGDCRFLEIEGPRPLSRWQKRRAPGKDDCADKRATAHNTSSTTEGTEAGRGHSKMILLNPEP